jgi:hypothetical protein
MKRRSTTHAAAKEVAPPRCSFHDRRHATELNRFLDIVEQVATEGHKTR